MFLIISLPKNRTIIDNNVKPNLASQAPRVKIITLIIDGFILKIINITHKNNSIDNIITSKHNKINKK